VLHVTIGVAIEGGINMRESHLMAETTRRCAARVLVKGSIALVIGVCVLVSFGLFVGTASSRTGARGQASPFHATKDCSGFTGLVGAFCTFRSSNLKAIKADSKIFYFQKASKTALDSDIVIYVGPGTVATGHCLLRFATGTGQCTVSDGTGALAGFQLRVRVTADKKVPELWHWDGTYSFAKS
jgi:hypothetical protein